MLLNHCSKWNNWSLERFSESSLIGSLPIFQDVVDVSQIAEAFRWISPPFFIRSSWSTFIYSSYWSLRNAICLGSMRAGRSVIPWLFFTGFATFLRMVRVIDFRLFWRLEKLSKTSLRLPRSLILHGTTAYQWLFRDSPSSLRTLWSAFIKSPNSVARGTASPVGLLQIALCHLGSQAYFAISVFWEVSINTVFLEFRYHFRRAYRIWVLRNVRARAFLCTLDCLRAPLTIPEDLANGLPLPDGCSPFCFVLGFCWIAPVSRCLLVTSL